MAFAGMGTSAAVMGWDGEKQCGDGVGKGTNFGVRMGIKLCHHVTL